MARPQKVGIDYFALDVKMDDEVEIIEAQYGLEGFAILIKLFQKIYSEGYFYEWGDRERILFSSRVNVDRNLVTSIVDDCIKWGIFDQGLFEEHNILTSRRIQNHYFTSTYKRVDVEAVEEYLLINVSDRNNILLIRVSDDRNKDTSIVTDDKSTQSKVKKSKVKKSILNKTIIEDLEDRSSSLSTKTVDNLKDNDIAKIAELFQSNGFGTINITVKEMLVILLEDYSVEWIIEAIKVAVKNNKRSLKYVEGILQNWRKSGGIKLESDKTINPPTKKTRFHNFEGRSEKYTSEQLEDVAARKRREYSEKLKSQKGNTEGSD